MMDLILFLVFLLTHILVQLYFHYGISKFSRFMAHEEKDSSD